MRTERSVTETPITGRRRAVNTRTAAVNEASTSGSGDPPGATVHRYGGPRRGPPEENGRRIVEDLLYVGLVIVMFAILVLAARGLERL